MSDILFGNGLCMTPLLGESVSLLLVMFFLNAKDWSLARFSWVRATRDTIHLVFHVADGTISNVAIGQQSIWSLEYIMVEFPEG